MCQVVATWPGVHTGAMSEDDRRAQILVAALRAFSTYGVAKTTMADIAASSGLSRPGLYQYFENKEDILVALIVQVIGDAADRAVAATEGDGTVAERIEGLLQRWFGDLYAELRASAHGIDLVEMKAGRAKPTLDEISGRVRAAAQALLGAGSRPELIDLLLLAPAGLKADAPDVTTYRSRLTALGASVTAALGSTEIS